MRWMSFLTRRARTHAPRARIAGPAVVGLLASLMLLLPSVAIGADHRPQSRPGSTIDLSAASQLEVGPDIVPTADEDEPDENERDENENEGDENERDENERGENDRDNSGDERGENDRDNSGDGRDEGGCRDFDDGEDLCLDEMALPVIETSPVAAAGSPSDLTAPVAAIGVGGLIAGAVALARRRRTGI